MKRKNIQKESIKGEFDVNGFGKNNKNGVSVVKKIVKYVHN